jgi:iron complex outermembrane recepter protein
VTSNENKIEDGVQTIHWARVGPLFVALIASFPASAQETTAPVGSGNLDEIVVTGTFIPITKQKATTAISIIDAEELQHFVPTTAIDVLSNVPGVFVDSSQGVLYFATPASGGNAVQSRGLAFTVIEEDGLPLEAASNVGQYGGSSSLLRADATLDQVQVVRGGSAAITGANAPGGIFNYISKTGGETLEGTATLSYGLQSNVRLPYERVDFDIGGPLAPGGWNFNIGGYYQHDDGMWGDGQFPDHGGQVKANITKQFEHSSLELYAKFLDDYNAWTCNGCWPGTNWTSPQFVAPFNNTSTGNEPPVSFNYRTGPNSYANFNQGNGIGNQLVSVGVKFDADFGGGWIFNNNARFVRSTETWNTDSLALPAFMTDPLNYLFTHTYGMAGTYTFYDPVTGQSAKVTTPNGTNFTVLSNSLPQVAGLPNTLLGHQATTYLFGDKIFQDQFNLTKKFDTMSFTVGTYFAYQRSSLLFQTPGDGFSDYGPSPSMLDITLTQPNGNVLQVTNPQGFGPSGGNNGSTVPHSTWMQVAPYIAHNWDLTNQWSTDWGVRYEYVRVNAFNDSGNDYSVTDSLNPNNLWANSYSVVAPLYHSVQSVGTVAYSAAVNYAFDKENSIYARYSLGKKSPDLGFYAGVNAATPSDFVKPLPEKVQQFEIGYKLYTPRVSLDVTPYYSVLTNIGSTYLQTVSAEGEPGVYGAFTPSNKTSDYGVEIDGQFHFDYGFALRTAVTWQKSKEIDSYSWTQPNGPCPASTPTSCAVLTNNTAGFEAGNIPRWLAMITPSYTNGRFYGQVQNQYTGDRQANNFDAWVLPGFWQTNLTLQWNFTNQLNASFVMNNVFNTVGVMEWAPPGDAFTGWLNAASYTRAQVAANPNATFSISSIQARALFLRMNYRF